jgi:phage terminase large subunit GpA-like protein
MFASILQHNPALRNQWRNRLALIGVALAMSATAAVTDISSALREEFEFFLQSARAPKHRPMRMFAEEEIIIPDGPFKGARFNGRRQPFAGLLLDEIDTNYWPIIALTGPVQSGKTLVGFVIPIIYHLFETRDNVVLAAPNMETAQDKWTKDIRPAIEATRYAQFLPKSGGGAKGGKVETIFFLNGASLKLMSGGGGDQKRSAWTARVIVITEVDKMDETGGTSRETNKIDQIIARSNAYGRRRRVYMECSASSSKGRIWQERIAGSTTRIAMPCPHCKAYVTPEREQLTGWQSAADVVEARANAILCCPSCGAAWSEPDRQEANRRGVLVHRGQDVTPDGQVTGPKPQTETFALRWSCVNNLFMTSDDVAVEEWRSQRAEDQDAGQKKMLQFYWGEPWDPPDLDDDKMDIHAISRRQGDTERCILPEWTEVVTVGVDVGKRLMHFVVVAWSMDARGHVVDYGVQEVKSDDMAIERAQLIAMAELDDRFKAGFMVEGSSEANPEKLSPTWVIIDSGYEPAAIYDFCRGHKASWQPYKGYGSLENNGMYRTPKAMGNGIGRIGEQYHVAYQKAEKIWLLEANADHWKGVVHRGLEGSFDQPGRLSLYKADAVTHLGFAKNMTAERKIDRFEPGKGHVTYWEQLSRNNHYLDALSMSRIAAHLCGVRILRSAQISENTNVQPASSTLTTPDGRAFVATQRN